MKKGIFFMGLFLSLCLTPCVLAQSGDGATWAQTRPEDGAGYDLDWWTDDGGGDTSPSGTGYSIGGTIGQADAATWQGIGGYTLAGGFWVTGPAVDGYEVFLPLVIRGTGP